jgi:hypothetical protein
MIEEDDDDDDIDNENDREFKKAADYYVICFYLYFIIEIAYVAG